MKNAILIAAGATLSLMAVSPAFATVGATGTVNLEGTVTAKCSNTGGAAPTIDLGELAQANGQVVSAFAGVTHAALTFVCTSAKPTVMVTATPLTGPATSDVGYTNLVQYTATVTPFLVGGGANGTLPTYNTAAGATGADTVQLSAMLEAAANNVSVDISAPSSNGGTLVSSAADGYTGAVTVTVTPTS